MSLPMHDPIERIRGLLQILVSDKKRIGFLFGAGSSLATGHSSVFVPAIDQMTAVVTAAVENHSTQFADAVRQIRDEIVADGARFSIESLLSNAEAKRAVVGSGTLNGLGHADLTELISIAKKQIVSLASVHDKVSFDERGLLAHARLATWLSRARRRYPVEIFTTNYDYLLELALEGLSIPYFDGFSGSFEPFFSPEAVEDLNAYAQLLKLWKVHGSIGWRQRAEDGAVIRGNASAVDSLLIYPSHLKYTSSRKQPYIALIDRLCAFLQQDDAVLITCGFSFGDDHLNERLITSLRRGANSHVFALLYDAVRTQSGNIQYRLADESDHVRRMAVSATAGRMSVYGLRHAVIGGHFAPWGLRREPTSSESRLVSSYFDEDAAIPSDLPGQHQGNESWSGSGRFLLPDFLQLTGFLNGMSSNEFTELS